MDEKGIFGIFFLSMLCIQHSFICRPSSDSTVSEDAGIEPWAVATSALVVRRSNLSARSHRILWNYVYGQLNYCEENFPSGNMQDLFGLT